MIIKNVCIYIERLLIVVFGSLDLSRSNSMTPCGQCRLAPLIPCVQDASKLYDYCVKMLFKLHSALPADTLAGHRERFLKQFRDLKSFYNTVMHMHYFKHLITIPTLPEVRIITKQIFCIFKKSSSCCAYIFLFILFKSQGSSQFIFKIFKIK